MSDIYAGIPKKLRVGFMTVEVKVVDEDATDVAGIFGASNCLNERIILRPGLKACQLVDTFIHELLHCIHHVYGVTDESSEEFTTTQSAHGLVTFWQDNPAAIKWIDDALKGSLRK